MQLSNKANERLWNAVLKEVLIDHLNCEAEQINEIIENGEKCEFSDDLRKNIRRTAGNIGRKERISKVLHTTFNAAVYTFSVIGILLAGLMTNKEVYASAEKVIRGVFETHDEFEAYNEFEIDLNDNDGDTDTGEFDMEKRPGYVPDGYELRLIKYFGKTITQTYESKDGTIKLLYCPVTDIKLYVDNEFHNYELIDNKYHYYESNEYGEDNILVWYDDKYFYHLNSVLYKDQLLKMAESVK